MKRYVLDTSILISALRSRKGASNRLLRLVALQRIRPLVTTALFLEYEAVLMRADQLQATGLSVKDVQRFLAAFASSAEPVDIQFRWRPLLKDPADEMVLETAVNGRADGLVTFNTQDFLPASQLGVNVLTPGQVLGATQ